MWRLCRSGHAYGHMYMHKSIARIMAPGCRLRTKHHDMVSQRLATPAYARVGKTRPRRERACPRCAGRLVPASRCCCMREAGRAMGRRCTATNLDVEVEAHESRQRRRATQTDLRSEKQKRNADQNYRRERKTRIKRSGKRF